MRPDPARSASSPPAGKRPRVAVIGGGISGLVAARELARAGVRVEILEAEDRLGGKIRQAPLGDAEFDIGAEAFATRGGIVTDFLDELGLADDAVYPAQLGSWCMWNERTVPIPPSGAFGIPAAPLTRAGIRALGAIGALRAAIEPVIPRTLGSNATNVATLVRARLGRRVLDRLVRPVALGVYSTEPERLPLSSAPELIAASAAHGSLLRAAWQLRDRARTAGSAVGALPGGMAPLIAALESELRSLGASITLGCRAVSLASRPGGWTVETAGGAESGDFDAALLAVPASVARSLLAGHDAQEPHTAELIADAHRSGDQQEGGRTRPEHPVEVVALLVDLPALDAAPRGTGVLVTPQASRVRAKALTHVTAKWPDRRARLPRGNHVLRLSYGRRDEAPATASLGDEEARSLAVADASLILGIRIESSDVRGFARHTWMMPSPPPAEPPALPPTLAATGDWLAGAGLAATIPHARRAARGLLSECGWAGDRPGVPHAPRPHSLTRPASPKIPANPARAASPASPASPANPSSPASPPHSPHPQEPSA